MAESKLFYFLQKLIDLLKQTGPGTSNGDLASSLIPFSSPDLALVF